jgi:TM2 domain-containing membrane protein YozV
MNNAPGLEGGASHVASAPPAPLTPTLSPDGRFWWSGTSWLPIPASALPVVYAAAVPYPSSKSKVVAGLLGIFLGGFGIHKFYLGQVGLGIFYFLFSWTLIPAIIGFIEGILYLVANDAEWAQRYPPITYGPPPVYGPVAQ